MLVLEDDATPLAAAPRDRTLYYEAWRGVWARIQTAVGALEDAGVSWDLLYVGRNRLGPAAAETPVVPGVTRAAFSSCTHAYVVSREGAAKLVAMADGGRLPCVPVDDLLPALYAEHPRPDLASWARTQPRLEAFAMAGYGDDGIVFQLEEVLLGCLQGGQSPEDPLLAAAAGSTLESSGSGSLDDDGGIQSVLCADAREASCMHATSICGLGAALWMQVAGHLGPRDLAALRATCGFFRRLLADERLWRAARLFQLWDAAARPEEVDLLTFNGRWGPGPAEPLGESSQGQLADCLAMSLAHHSQIASCAAQDMNAEVFAREFEASGRALVLRGAAGPSMCELWAVDHLEAVCGEGQLFRCIVPGASAPPLRVRMTLPSYRRYLDSTRERDHALYLFEDNLPEAIRRLPLPDAVQSLFGGSDLLAACLAQAREANDDVDMEHEWLAIGPAGSGSRLHTDPHGTSAFNLLWSGQKLWAIFDDDDDHDEEENEEDASGGGGANDNRPDEGEERPAIDTAHSYAVLGQTSKTTTKKRCMGGVVERTFKHISLGFFFFLFLFLVRPVGARVFPGFWGPAAGAPAVLGRGAASGGRCLCAGGPQACRSESGRQCRVHPEPGDAGQRAACSHGAPAALPRRRAAAGCRRPTMRPGVK
jgi:hypothetical protein